MLELIAAFGTNVGVRGPTWYKFSKHAGRRNSAFTHAAAAQARGWNPRDALPKVGRLDPHKTAQPERVHNRAITFLDRYERPIFRQRYAIGECNVSGDPQKSRAKKRAADQCQAIGLMDMWAKTGSRACGY